MNKFVVIASVLVGVANAALIFDATRCNTNLNNGQNWNGTNPWTRSDASEWPSTVMFGSGSGPSRSARPVDIRVDSGTYNMGSMQLEPNMVLNLAPDGVFMNFGEFTGEPAQFEGGQLDTPECSMGCSDNFLVGTLDDAGVEDYTTLDLPRAAPGNGPCSGDDVVIPRGYSAVMSAWGFTAINRLVTMSDGGEPRYMTSITSIPNYTIFPTEPEMMFGNDALDHCATNGILTATRDSCICQERCLAPIPVPSDGSGYLEAIAKEALSIIQQSSSQSSILYGRGLTQVSTQSVTFSYNGVIGSDGQRAPSMAALQSCEGAVSTNLESRILSYLPDGSSIVGGVTYSLHSGVDASGATGAITVAFDLSGPMRYVDAISTSMTVEPFVTRYDSNSSTLAMFAVWNALGVEFSMCSTSSVLSHAWQDQAGFNGHFLTLYVGATVPQVNIPLYINSENRAAYAAALKMGLNNVHGVYDLSLSYMQDRLAVRTEMEAYSARHAGTNISNAGVLPSDGIATRLIQVTLAFSSYGPVPDFSAQQQTLTQIANQVTALFTLNLGVQPCLPSDFSCVTAKIQTTIEGQLNTVDLASLDGDAQNAKRLVAREAALDLLLQVFGACGPSGDWNSMCTDPAWNTKASNEATRLGDVAFDAMFTAAGVDILAPGDRPSVALTTTADPNAKQGANNGGDDDNSSSSFPIVIVAVVCACALLIVIVLIVTRRNKKANNGPERIGVVAFDNPMYDGPDTGAKDEDAEGLYDDPTFQESTTDEPVVGGYLDVQPDEDDDEDDDDDVDAGNGGYLDVDGGDDGVEGEDAPQYDDVEAVNNDADDYDDTYDDEDDE